MAGACPNAFSMLSVAWKVNFGAACCFGAETVPRQVRHVSSLRHFVPNTFSGIVDAVIRCETAVEF